MRKLIGMLGIVVLGLASSAQPAAAAGPQKPDALIAKGGGAPVGDGVYGADGSGETISAKVKAGGPKLTFPLSGQNEGAVSDLFLLHGCSSSGALKVKYKEGTTNVTAAVTAGTFITPLMTSGADFDGIAMKVKATTSAHAGTHLDCDVTMTSKIDGTKSDTVSASVTVK